MARSQEAPLICRSEALAGLCDELRAAECFAFDTEFVGEETYQPKLCLIQVATRDRCRLIDPLAGLDTRPFWELVGDDAVRKVVHAGGEDLALCRRQFDVRPANVVDLQIAAGFVGIGYPVSLARLVGAVLGKRLHKSQTLTDWRRRPLGPEQLKYAVEDVQHLPAAYEELMARIEARGRTHWLAEECGRLADVTEERGSNHQGLKRLRGTASLTRKQLAIVAAIVELRDELARKYNRPARTVLKDHLIVEVARSGWSDPERLRTLRGMNLSKTDLKSCAAAVERAKQLPAERCPQPSEDDSFPDEETLLPLLSSVLRSYCVQQGIAYSLLATKQDLRAFVTRPEAGPRGGEGKRTAETGALRRGWRGEAVGPLLDRIMSGQAVLRVCPEGGLYRLMVE